VSFKLFGREFPGDGDQPDKVKYILVQYVHLLILRDCNETCQFVICADGNLLDRSRNSVEENTVVVLDTVGRLV